MARASEMGVATAMGAVLINGKCYLWLDKACPLIADGGGLGAMDEWLFEKPSIVSRLFNPEGVVVKTDVFECAF